MAGRGGPGEEYLVSEPLMRRLLWDGSYPKVFGNDAAEGFYNWDAALDGQNSPELTRVRRLPDRTPARGWTRAFRG